MKRTYLQGIIGLFLSLVLFSHCTKLDPTDIGSGLIPPVDNVSTFDTTLLVVSNNIIQTPDSTRYFPGTNPVIGAISNDPQFGKTVSKFFVEFRPVEFPFQWGAPRDSLILDSIVLCLSYNGTWGDTVSPITFDVYRLDDTLTFRDYPTDTTFSYSTLYGSKTFSPRNLRDTNVLQREPRTARQLRIPLSNDLGNAFLSQDTFGAFSRNRVNYKTFIPGFAIVPQASGQALLNFELTSTNTGLFIYYRRQVNGQPDTTRTRFYFTTNGGNIAGAAVEVDRDYTGSQVAGHLTPTPQGDELAFIQTMPGSFVNLTMPSLTAFRALKGNVVVHRAELRMERINSPGELDEQLTAPPYLYLDAYSDTAAGFEPLALDLRFDQDNQPVLSTFGGNRVTRSTNGMDSVSYSFLLTRTIQNIITRNNGNPPKLRLWAPYYVTYPRFNVIFGLNNLGVGRVKLGGGRHPAQPMRLRIIYSTL